MKLKKTFTALGMVLVLTLMGCGSMTSELQGKTTSYTSVTNLIGICQTSDHKSLNRATEGFRAAIRDSIGYTVIETYKIADGSYEKCYDIVNQMVEQKPSVIMCAGTNALMAAAFSTSDIPIVGTAVCDYASTLGLDDWTGRTGTNVTGTSNLIPIGDQAEMIRTWFPEVKSVGLLYCMSESNSVYQIEQLKRELDHMDIAYTDYFVYFEADIEAVATEAAENTELVYIPTDNMMATSVDKLKKVFTTTRTPMVCADEYICRAGVASFDISYYQLGYSAGLIAADIIYNDINPREIYIEYADSYQKKYNAQMCELLGITEIPEGYEPIEQ